MGSSITDGNIHVASTTGDQAAVEAAADYQPTESSSSGTVTAVSTTDSRTEVAKGAMLYAKDDAKVYTRGAEFPGSAGMGIAVGNAIVQIPPPTDGVHIRSIIDDAEHVEAQRKEAVEEKEANRVDYLTRQPKVEKESRLWL